MSVEILPLCEGHFEPLFQAFSGVVREKKYLSWITVPPWDESLAYYRTIIENENPAYVAITGKEVLGLCEISRPSGDAHTHVGQLGIFLSPDARRKGTGKKLMLKTMCKAYETGMTRIELGVRADNSSAMSLYKGLGFEIEGRHRGSFLVDGRYYDSYTMAYLNGADV